MRLSRRQLLGSIAAAACNAHAADAADIGSRKQLFIDRKWIRNARGVQLNVNPPQKDGIVLEGTVDWEKDHIGSYLSVIEHEGMLRMWYMAFAGKGGGRLCYATSSDGVHWQRPKLGLVEFQGSRENNIVLGSFREGAVMLDPVAPPQERFKTLASYGGKRPSALGVSTIGSLMLMSSPDGIHWNRERQVLPFHPDSMNTLFWDQRIGKYAAYLRGWNPLRVAVRAEIARDQVWNTWPFQSGVTPRYLWSFLTKGTEVWPPAITKEMPTVIAADSSDPKNCDIYTPNVQPYPWADDVYLAFPSMFRHTAPPGSNGIPMAGVLDVQLAVSRDGITFLREDRRSYVSRGLPGDADSHSIYMGLGLIRRGAYLYQYYAGGSTDHAASLKGRSALMRAKQRLDGFVSVDATRSGGAFTTPPLIFRGKSLHLNIDASALGTAMVEILDAEGRPVKGFELEDCAPITANDVAFPVKWTGGKELSTLQGKPVALRFLLANAKLFAFQFAD